MPGTVPTGLDRAAAWSWRVLVVAAAAFAALWLLARLWLAIVPVGLAILIARILIRPVNALHDRGWKRGLAAGATLAAFLLAVVGVVVLVGAAVADEIDTVGPTVEDAVDDVEHWLVEDAPFNLDRQTVREVRADIGNAFDRAVRGSGDDAFSGAVVLAELVVGLLVGLVMGFYALKDGGRFLTWTVRRFPTARRSDAARAGRRAWATLGGFLRGAALLGVVEGVVIGVAVFATGGSLAVPLAVMTFLAAFVPFVGAIVAGVIAVLVTLTTAGVTAAAIVAVVVLLLQQFDNEVFAPLVYGHTMRLHPVVVLLAVVVGGAAFGAAGSVLAVPVAAVVINVIDELNPAADLTVGGEEPSGSTPDR